jgi:ribosomal protein S18 acetylase RimI-like enzyme
MSIEYRNAEPSDAPAIADLFCRCFTETFGDLYAPEDLRAFLSTKTVGQFGGEVADESFDFLLATDSGELAGFVKLGPPELPVETPPDTIELCQFYVLNRWHGSGIASALMDQSLAIAAGKGARHVQLSVFVENHRALRFYERYGFVPVGRYDFMVGSHVDEDLVLRHVVMQADQ